MLEQEPSFQEVTTPKKSFDTYLQYADHVIASQKDSPKNEPDHDSKTLNDFLSSVPSSAEYLQFLTENKAIFKVLEEWYSEIEKIYYNSEVTDLEKVRNDNAKNKLIELLGASFTQRFNPNVLIKVADVIMTFSYSAYIAEKSKTIMHQKLHIPVELNLNNITLSLYVTQNTNMTVRSESNGSYTLTMPQADFSYGFVFDTQPNPLISVYGCVHELTHIYTDQVLQKEPGKEIPVYLWMILQEVGSFLAEELLSQLEENDKKPFLDYFTERELKHSKKTEGSEHRTAREVVKALRAEKSFGFEEYVQLLKKLHSSENLMDYNIGRSVIRDFFDVLIQLAL